MRIKDMHAHQIYDSRGIPTVEVRVELMNGAVGRGSAPSGASTGSYEAFELRDGAEAYFGKGVSCAVENVNSIMRPALTGMRADNQQGIDSRLCELDGSENKSVLGANAIIAASWAIADAAAKGRGMELFRWLGGVQASQMPCPMFNVINGGCHANNNLEIQEFMFVPNGADTFRDAMRMGTECYQALRRLLVQAQLTAAVGDEGGFAPNLDSDAQALEWMMRAIEAAGWKAGEDVSLALDAAASEWASDDGYRMRKSGRHMHRSELIDYFEDLAARFPLVSIEDPLGEEDFDGFREITRVMGKDTMIVGDDLFTTNVRRLGLGIASEAANAILIKPNQIGTVSETMDTISLARKNAYSVIISHRSGETLSSAVSDLAVAVNAEYIKAGAPARGERLAKYNRLMEIEESL